MKRLWTNLFGRSEKAEAQAQTQVAESRVRCFGDYSVNPQPRYGYGKPEHPDLYDTINKNTSSYITNLNSFLQYKAYFTKISKVAIDNQPTRPAWINDFLPGLDAVALYGFLCLNNPRNYYEIGSGNSTKFARQAINDHNLRTKITSIDPYPRAEIDTICDNTIRQPAEDIDLGIFDKLGAEDILFVDGSHRVLMNSDVTVVFLDILPRLRPGVLVEFHDIFLPSDYPPVWKERYYSEQYLLAAYILAEGNKFDIILPNAFISMDPELRDIMSPLWKDPRLEGIETHGLSFWIKMR